MVISKKKLDKDDVSENLTVTTEEQPSNIDPSNEDIAQRAYVFPLLSKGITQLGRKYPDDPRKSVEAEWQQFKAKSDLSIPVQRTITNIYRIRTLSNEEQTLGEYVYCNMNLVGFQKSYSQSEGKTITYPVAEAVDIPFGMDIQKANVPNFKNGQEDGFKEGEEKRFYTTKFTPDVIDEMLKGHTQLEGVPMHFTIIDTGSNYGGYTQEEIQTCKFNRLIYRNQNKLNGTEISAEDKIK